MRQKIKMAALLLSCATALSGCVWDRATAEPPRLTIPEQAAPCDAFPPPPAGPLNCTDMQGLPALCQSEIAIWIEVDVKPAYDQCYASNQFLRRQITQ